MMPCSYVAASVLIFGMNACNFYLWQATYLIPYIAGNSKLRSHAVFKCYTLWSLYVAISSFNLLIPILIG